MNPFLRILNGLYILLQLIVTAEQAYACASCGSGGDDPLILYPNERIKDYFGLSQTGNFKNVNPDGSTSSAGGPSKKQTWTLATGRSFSPRAFMTLTVPYIKNFRDEQSKASLGDPSLAGRYSLVLQSFDDPWTPQVQVVYGYKLSNAQSIHESRDLKTLLDVFGNGFSEIKVGADIWFGQTRWKPGISQLFSWPQQRTFNGVSYRPGLHSRTTVSLGYNWFENWKMTIGVNRDSQGRLRLNGEEQDDSAQLNHSLFLSSDVMISGVDSVRLSLSRQAALFQNYSTSKSETVSFAYMHSF